MEPPQPPRLTPQKGLIFRLTHVSNLPWILRYGLHCRSSAVIDGRFTAIGNPDLIDQRRAWPVRHGSGGVLADYVPFYFVPQTPMLLNIQTGRNVRRRRNDEIAIVVSSIARAKSAGCKVIFTDRHAKLWTATFFDDTAGLDPLPWQAWNTADFKKDPADPEAFDRYQAEALVKGHLPAAALMAIGCCSQQVASNVDSLIKSAGLNLLAISRPNWYMP